MEITWTTTQLDGATYVLIEPEDGERVTVLDRRLIPIGQVAVFLGGPAWGGLAWSVTRFRPGDFSSHAVHTYREALDYLIPGLAHALLD